MLPSLAPAGLILASALASPARPAAPHVAESPATGDPPPPAAVARLGTTPLGHAIRVTSVCYSAGGTLLAYGGRGRLVRLRDSRSGREVRTFPTGGLRRVAAFAPDGKTLATVRMRAVVLWEAAMGRKSSGTRDDANRQVDALASSPVGGLPCTGGQDGGIRVWVPATVSDHQSRSGHAEALRPLTLADDVRRLASAGGDPSALVGEVTGSVGRVLDAGAAGRLRPAEIDGKHLRLIADPSGGVESVRKAARAEPTRPVSPAEAALRWSLAGESAARVEALPEECPARFDEPVRPLGRVRCGPSKPSSGSAPRPRYSFGSRPANRRRRWHASVARPARVPSRIPNWR
jgi:hypothetical protein